MNTTNPLLTIIVPAYNVERYLDECLSSLLNQTVDDHKVIVVNDGSTDSTGKIAKQYADDYPEMFTYLEQENQGLGATRNRALSLVDTDYVTFLDSDDFQDCMFVEKLKNELSRHENVVDIVFSLPWVMDSITRKISPWRDKILFEQLFYPNGGYENVESVELNAMSCPRLYALEASACRRIFRTDFLRSIGYTFPVGVKWEDVWPHFASIHHAKCCIGLKSTGFIYRINTSGQITSGGGSSRLDIATVFKYVIDKATVEKWSREEFSYIIHTFYDFTRWTIEVTNTDYINPVLDSLHKLYISIPKTSLRYYYQFFGVTRLDKIIITTLRSPFYKIFRDYRYRKILRVILERLHCVKAKFRR